MRHCLRDSQGPCLSQGRGKYDESIIRRVHIPMEFFRAYVSCEDNLSCESMRMEPLPEYRLILSCSCDCQPEVDSTSRQFLNEQRQIQHSLVLVAKSSDEEDSQRVPTPDNRFRC